MIYKRCNVRLTLYQSNHYVNQGKTLFPLYILNVKIIVSSLQVIFSCTMRGLLLICCQFLLSENFSTSLRLHSVTVFMLVTHYGAVRINDSLRQLYNIQLVLYIYSEQYFHLMI